MGKINESSVLDFYLDEIQRDGIKFLIGRENYKKKITEEIIDLRDRTSMHERIQTAKKLWKLLFEASMSYIDPDKRGYDDLFRYFDEYVNFEELIFASDSFYRDHTLHCLWVYFLGEYILKSGDFKHITESMRVNRKMQIGILNALSELSANDGFSGLYETYKAMAKIFDNGDSISCMAALTHDLGYPIKKISRINKCIKEVLPYFSIHNYDEFNFNYSEVQQSFIKDFIDLLSRGISYQLEVEEDDDMKLFTKVFDIDSSGENVNGIKRDGFNNLSKAEKSRLKELLKLHVKINNNISPHLRFSNDFEQYQHGIMSAYLLMKNVKSFSNMRYSYYDNIHVPLNHIDYVGISTKQMILTAITNHTSEGYQITEIGDISSFLTFIDELEEFSRISRANQNRQYVNEFCKTDIRMEDDYFQVDFIFDNEEIDNLDPERAFKGRCKKFLSLFDIPKLGQNLKIRLRCIGRLKYDTNEYVLEIARKYACITINGKEKNIPSYLKSNQFYSREEYMSM